MMSEPILVVMAAGMGSRYGGLKQIDPVGSHGESILDYSLFDAYEAGFRTAVIVIKEAIKRDFMETVGKRLQKCPMEIRYAYQELDKLPEGFTVPEGRTKPWGTAHAVLCAAEAIGDHPFAVLNADDYYGKSAFKVIYNALSGIREPGEFFMVGYELGKTVTDAGSVARGVCETNEDSFLTRIVERTRIEKYDGGVHFTEDGESWVDLPAETLVSMNFWGFTPAYLAAGAARFPSFLEEALKVNPLKCEFFLPFLVDEMMKAGKATVKVLSSSDRWYGVTYAADKPGVVAALQAMADEGKYPADGLWK